MSKELIQEIYTLREKIEQLDRWLCEHYDHPDRAKVRSDRNAFAVKLQTAKYKLENRQSFKPDLGYGEGMPVNSIEHRKTQSKQ